MKLRITEGKPPKPIESYAIKFRVPGERRFCFLSGQCNATRLRIRANRYANEKAAEERADYLRKLNPQHVFKVVKLRIEKRG